MIETPNLFITPRERGVSYQSMIRREARWFVRKEEYREIPPFMKRAAKYAAIKALTMPREVLYKQIVGLDKKAEDMPDTVVFDVNNPIQSLQDYRMKKLGEIKNRISLSEMQRSTYLTRMDRMLIAARETFNNISRLRGKNSPEIYNNRDFIAAQKLSLEIVKNMFVMLPMCERRDPEIMDFDPDVEFRHFTKWMHQAAVFNSTVEV